MENRKTAEEIIIPVLRRMNNSSHEVQTGSGFYMYETFEELYKDYKNEINEAMQTFAEQEKEVWSCEFLDWAEKDWMKAEDGLWGDTSCKIIGLLTTKELYQIFKSERDGK